MDGRLSTEAIAFYFESEDLQVGIFNSNTTSLTLQSAAVAINYGAEISTIYPLNENWQLRGARSYAYLEFDVWDDAGCNSVDVPETPIGTCFTNAQKVAVQDVSGEQYGGPHLSINIGATYSSSAFEGWGLEASIDTIHHSEGELNPGCGYVEVHKSPFLP